MYTVYIHIIGSIPDDMTLARSIYFLFFLSVIFHLVHNSIARYVVLRTFGSNNNAANGIHEYYTYYNSIIVGFLNTFPN